MRRFKKAVLLAVLFSVCGLMTSSVKALDPLQISLDQYAVEDGEFKIYMNHNRGSSFSPSPEDLKVMFGAQEMKTNSVMRFSDSNEPVSYKCIVDVSGSMDQGRIDEAVEMIKLLGSIKGPEDNLAITVMADDLDDSPYMTDPGEIEELADTIKVTRQDTNLYYSIVQELKGMKTDGEVHRKRCIIFFSDGADDNVVGITRQEAEKMVEESHIPIFTVALLKQNHSNADEEAAKILGSFARLSNGGVHFAPALGVGSDESIPAAIVDTIEESFILSEDLHDISVTGTEIVLKVTADAEDGQSASTELKLPEGDVKTIQKAIEELEPTQEPEPKTVVVHEEKEKKHTILGLPVTLFIILLIAIVFVIAVIIILLKGRRDRQLLEEEAAGPEPSDEPEPDKDKTLMGPGNSPTVGIPSGFSSENYKAKDDKNSKNRISVVLTRVGKNESGTFKADVADSCPIGRSASKAKLSFPEDTALSGIHCTLFVKEKKLFIRDENSTNGNFVNGVPVNGPLELQQDDTILIGSHEYRITWK